MLNDVRFETDTTTDFDDRVHRWRAMNLDHDLVDELAWAAPRVKDKRLIISPQVEEVDNWQGTHFLDLSPLRAPWGATKLNRGHNWETGSEIPVQEFGFPGTTSTTLLVASVCDLLSTAG